MVKQKKVYLASGWFTPHTKQIVDELEVALGSIEGLTVYSPRRDGTALTPNEFGNTEVRRKVFQDNVDNIRDADFLVACLDGKDGHLDTGTVWEVGLATAMNIPVYAYEAERGNGGHELAKGISSLMADWAYGIDNLVAVVKDAITLQTPPRKSYVTDHRGPMHNRVLIMGPDYTNAHGVVNLDVLAAINTTNTHARLVDEPSNPLVGEYADDLFTNIDYFVAVVDDRHPVVSWAMGQAYVRNIPIISFTNHDYGVNLMLLLSILRHVKGTDKLIEFINEIKEKGISNIGQIDYADVRAI